MRQLIRETLYWLLIGIAVAVSIFLLTGLFAGRIFPPSVYKSWSTKECVRVEPESAGTCEDLPDEYLTVWVR